MQVIRWLVYFGIIISFVLINGCSHDLKVINLDIKRILTWESSMIRIHFTKLKNRVINEKTYIFISGSAEFSNYGINIKSVNLNCLSISIGSSKSERVYVSSMASFFTKGYPLSEDLTLISLYWEMNRTVDDAEIDTLIVYVKEDCRLLSEIDWKKDRQWEKNLPTVDQEMLNQKE